jgi:hypothetical protein
MSEGMVLAVSLDVDRGKPFIPLKSDP